MATLRQQMAEYGFESNESYDYVVRCLQNAAGPALRCLNIEGDAGRRKTAFANALAHSLGAGQILYYDFTQAEEAVQPRAIKPGEDDEGKEEPPIGLFDRTMNDACAFSEGEKTILILDQLQAGDFKDHIRIYRFLVDREWQYRDTTFYANRNNLYVFLISEEPLYHSLQKHSFKAWVKSSSEQAVPFKPTDFQLDNNAGEFMNALHIVFQHLNLFPTYSEYKKIIHDIQHHVHSANDLKNSIYGWTEGVDRNLLYSEELHPVIQNAMLHIEAYIGIEENLELTSSDIPE